MESSIFPILLAPLLLQQLNKDGFLFHYQALEVGELRCSTTLYGMGAL